MPINHNLVADGTPLVGATEWNDTHTVPTLAEVLVAGNDPGGTDLIAATHGGRLALSEGANDPNGYGGDSIIMGGASPGNVLGARFQAQGGESDAAGLAGGFLTRAAGGSAIGLAGVGQVLMGSPDPGATIGVMALANIYSQAAGAPGATLTTLFYGDTTAVTGGLYVWNVSAYRKVSGVLP